MNDAQLIEKFNRGSQSAFTELVGRHVHWVHSCARRQVHDSHLADDVTQAVFVLLAQKARKLTVMPDLSPWLFQAVRFISKGAMKAEVRRRRRETKAAQMKPQSTDFESESSWSEISEVLDQSVARLRREDRRAVLLRFYEQKSFPEVAAVMQISEDAARRRVSRAVESLRVHLRRGGVVSPASSLAPMLLASATHLAPAALVSSVAPAAGTSAVSLLAQDGARYSHLSK